ncbi:MAG TPA: hypothetical protein VIV60_36805, partial [Polyangiaceae bacterium]
IPTGGPATQSSRAAANAIGAEDASRPIASIAVDLIWNSGSPLSGRPVLGKDGRLRVASRQGSFDVMTASGQLEYSVNLGAAPTGEVYVDERGWAYVGLATDKVVALSADGRKQFTYPSPIGVRGDIGFAEGQGLLFSGHDGQVLGLNRGGFPTMRLDPKGVLTAGPVGVGNWCVVGTATGDVVWGDRWGKRRRVVVGASVLSLLPSADDGVWVLTADALIALSRMRDQLFRMPDVAVATTSGRKATAKGVVGAALNQDGSLLWLHGDGSVAAKVSVGRVTLRGLELTLDHDDRIWMSGADQELVSWEMNGARSSHGDFAEPPYRPIFDPSRRQGYVATPSGRIFRIALPASTNPPRTSAAH